MSVNNGHGNLKQLSEELNRLMVEEIESLKRQAYRLSDEQELREQEARLKRIREVSADLLQALNANRQ